MDKDSKTKKHDELESLQQECQKNFDGWQRALADYQNLKKESEEQQRALADYVKMQLFHDFVPVIDMFDRALSAVPADLEGNDWVTGIQHIKKRFDEFFENNGIQKIDALGHPFDPDMHDAVGEEESEEKSGVVIKEISAGYMQGEKVLVPAKVIIAK